MDFLNFFKQSKSMGLRSQWLIASLVISALVLVGMFLPWVIGVDIASFSLSGETVNGWNVGWLMATIVIGIMLCIGLVFVTTRLLTLLSVTTVLFCCVVSLIQMVSLGATVIGGAGKSSYGTFLISSEVPMTGFWLTVFGTICVIVFVVAIGIKTILPKK